MGLILRKPMLEQCLISAAWFSWSKSSCFTNEMFFFVTSRAEQFDVLTTSIASVLIAMMYLEDVWNSIVTASFAAVWSRCENLLALNVCGYRNIGKLAVFASNPITSTAAIDNSRFRNIVRVAIKLRPTYDAYSCVPRSSPESSRRCMQSWHDVDRRAFNTAKPSFAVLFNLLIFAAVHARKGFHRLADPMASNKSAVYGRTSELFTTAARANPNQFKRSLLVERQVVVLYRVSGCEIEPTTARAKLTRFSFWVGHQVFPILRVVLWNVFGHARDLLCGPFQKRLTVSWA